MVDEVEHLLFVNGQEVGRGPVSKAQARASFDDLVARQQHQDERTVIELYEEHKPGHYTRVIRRVVGAGL